MTTNHHTSAETVDGYDATHWRDSYRMLAEAVATHLAAFVQEDDVAEEAICVDAIESAGAFLSQAQRGERDTAERVLAWLLTPGTLNDRWLRDSLCKALQDQFGGWDQQVATLCAALASASPETPTQESGR